MTTGSDPASTLAALREQGVAGFDPARWRYLEVLAERLPTLAEAARQHVSQRLQQALHDYQQRQLTTHAAADISDANTARPAATASPLAELLQRLHAASVAPSTLPPGSNTSTISATHATSADGTPSGAASSPPAELKTLRQHRATWAQLSLDRLLQQAQSRAPENAGPLNSHLLILRTLHRLRDLSPAYLAHFIAYADALQWLDQRTAPAPRSAAKVTAKSSPKSTPKASAKAAPKRGVKSRPENPTF